MYTQLLLNVLISLGISPLLLLGDLDVRLHSSTYNLLPPSTHGSGVPQQFSFARAPAAAVSSLYTDIQIMTQFLSELRARQNKSVP